MSSSREVIATLTDNVRNKLGVSLEKNVDMLEVLEKLGIRLKEYDYKGAEGAVSRDSETGEYIISLEHKYNSNNPRDKFTLAHELGHIFLHFDSVSEDFVFTRKGTTQAEYDANEFAANFLMPKNLYLDAIRQLVDNHRVVDVNQLAKTFGVSYDAAVTRGRFLGVFAW